MKNLVIILIIHILWFIFLDFIFVKYDLLKGMPDGLFWLVNFLIFATAYYFAYLKVEPRKWLSAIYAILSFVLFGVLAIIMMLVFHVYILKAPL